MSQPPRNIEAIKHDAEQWQQITLFKRFWTREKIKVALFKHNRNLEDCFRSFQVIFAKGWSIVHLTIVSLF